MYWHPEHWTKLFGALNCFTGDVTHPGGIGGDFNLVEEKKPVDFDQLLAQGDLIAIRLHTDSCFSKSGVVKPALQVDKSSSLGHRCLLSSESKRLRPRFCGVPPWRCDRFHDKFKLDDILSTLTSAGNPSK